MSDLTYLVPALLLCRIVLDLVGVLSGRSSYRLDFAYFLVFLAACIAIISSGSELWAALSFGIAAYSLFQLSVKRDRR